MKPLNNRFKTWQILSVIFVLVLVVAPIVLVALLSSSNPVVLETDTLDTESSVQAMSLADRLREKIRSSADLETVTAKENEINGLIQLAMRGMPRLRGRMNVTPLGLEGAFSFHVHENPLGEYLNIRFGLLPSSNGLIFSHSSIGNIEFSGETTLSLLRYFLDIVLANKQGTELISAVKSVDLANNEIKVVFRPIPDLKERLFASKERFKAIRDDLALLGDPALVRLYYEKLCAIDSLHVGNLPVSVAWYMAPVFDLASKRVELGNDILKENQAAILAIGIFLGSGGIESLVGPVGAKEMTDCRMNPRYVVLADRRDLRLHFVISAVLKVISDSGMSSAVGEFKELLDAASGGTGFSFVDLTADMAGVRFAEQLLDPEKGPRALTTLANTTDEFVFFPFIGGLTENIPQQQFESEYGDINDPRYQSVVAEIKHRISTLPLYATPSQ